MVAVGERKQTWLDASGMCRALRALAVASCRPLNRVWVSPTMKLTPELLAQASSALNPIKERQLDLRGKPTEIRVVIVRQLSSRIQNPRDRKPWCDQGTAHGFTSSALL